MIRKILFSILFRIRFLILLYNKNKYKGKILLLKEISPLPWQNLKTYNHDQIITKLQYKDNTWNHIQNIHLLMWNDIFKLPLLQYKGIKLEDNFCPETKIYKRNNQVICQIKKGIPNEWIFLLIPNNSDTYEFSFKAKIGSINSEFQIAFNYESIGKRYRFNLVNNKSLNFDIVENGTFYNQLYSIPYSLKIDTIYKFTLQVHKNQFKYLINDKKIMGIELKTKNLLKGDIALILWNSSPNPINVIYEDFQLKTTDL